MNSDPNHDPLKTLAERCFDYEFAESKLYDALHEIMGGTDDFYPVLDSWTDYYDRSVEVVLDVKSCPIDQEKADKILLLGFSCIYESQGERGAQWTKTGSYPCSYRKADSNSEKVKKLTHRLNQTSK